MDEVLEQLKSIPGAADLHAKLAEQWKATSTELDTLKAESGAAKKKLTQADKDLAKYKGDLDAAGKGADERLATLTKERDEAKALAEKVKGDFDGHLLRSAVGDKLGITDAVKRKRATDAFVREYMPEGAGLTDKGELQGVDKAVESFKKAEAYFFGDAVEVVGAQRAGSGAAPAKPAGGHAPKTGSEKVNAWRSELYPTAQKGAKT